jgi:hypothetical protein
LVVMLLLLLQLAGRLIAPPFTTECTPEATVAWVGDSMPLLDSRWCGLSNESSSTVLASLASHISTDKTKKLNKTFLLYTVVKKSSLAQQ